MTSTPSKATAGPWFVTRKHGVGPRSDNDDQTNGMVVPIADVFGDNQSEDARLIAAAPDLLAALMVIRHQWAGHSDQCAYVLSHYKDKCDCDWPAIAKQCDAAISRATGEA